MGVAEKYWGVLKIIEGVLGKYWGVCTPMHPPTKSTYAYNTLVKKFS